MEMSGQLHTPTTLFLWPYKTMIFHALKEHDLVARIIFCYWFLWSIHDGEVDPQLVFFSNDAWFSLCREVNSQNNQNPENPRLIIHGLPLHDERIDVWCVISAHKIIGPAFIDCYP
jgi:hypothetical protein